MAAVLRWIGVGFFLLAICACGTSSAGVDGGGQPVDAGGGVDAAPGMDGGLVDGGRPLDAGGGSDASGGTRISFSRDVQPIFTASCVFSDCHGRPADQAALDLSPGNAYANLVNVQSAEGCGVRVTPGDSSSSYLAAKITGEGICFGVTMPRIGSISASQVQTILGWIDEGAPRN